MGEPSNPSDAYDPDGEEAPRAPRRSRHPLRLPTELNRMDAPDDSSPVPAASSSRSEPESSAALSAPGEPVSATQEVEVHFDTTSTVSLPPAPARTPPPESPAGSMLVVRRRVRMIGQEAVPVSSPPPWGPTDAAPQLASPSPRIPEYFPAEFPAAPSSDSLPHGAHGSSPTPALAHDAVEALRMTLPMAEPGREPPATPPSSSEEAVPQRPSSPPSLRRPSSPPPPPPPSKSPTANAPAPSTPPPLATSVSPVSPPALPPLPSQQPPPLPRASESALAEDNVLEIERISTPPDDDGIDVSIDDGSPAQVSARLPEEVSAAPPTERTSSPVDPPATALDDVAEVSTEAHEILDPDAIEHVDTPPRGTSLPPPPPKDIPRPPNKTSMPPAAPSKVTGHATVLDARPKRRRMWWEEIFNEDYFRTMEQYTPEQVRAEVDWIEHALGVEAGAAILDVGCGAGRQAVELARRRYEVTGVDLSVAMLTRAAERAQEQKVHVAFTQCDMAAMEFDECYDAAYCVGSSFGFFDDARNAEVARRIHRALKPHGTFLLAVLNRDHTIQRQPAMAWFEGDGCVCMEESSFNFITSRLNVKRTMIFDDGRQREFEYSMRLYSLHELGQVLHEAGFRILEVSGAPRTPGAFFGPTSRELIILAQKRGQEVVDLNNEAGDSSRPT